MSKTVYMRSADGEVFSTKHPEYHKECEHLGSGTKGYAARQEYARTKLREMIKPGDAVYTILRRVSSSGMSRDISVVIVQGGSIRNLDALVSDACGIKEAESGPGLRIGGCGMDMGFHLVYSLGRALFPDGFGMTGRKDGKEKRPATKRAAAAMVKAGWEFRGRNGDTTGWDNDGGYALGKNWL